MVGGGSQGSGTGIGKAIAIVLARQGVKVTVVDKDLSRAQETCDIITREGGACVALACDVGISNSVAEMVAAVVEADGRVDGLVNNVGLTLVGGLLEVTDADWETMLTVNLKGPTWCCKHCVPHMLAAGRGSIVNVSSISSIRALRPEIAYTTTKGALNSLTQSIAMEFAGRALRCNAVLPGLIQTPLVRGMLIQGSHGQVDEDQIQQAINKRHRASPTGQMGQPWEVAHMVAFLLSDEASYVNGQLINVDAGLTLTAAL